MKLNIHEHGFDQYVRKKVTGLPIINLKCVIEINAC